MERRNQERSRKVSSDNTSVVYCDKLGSLIYSSFILNLVVFEHTYTPSLKVNLFVSITQRKPAIYLVQRRKKKRRKREVKGGSPRRKGRPAYKE